MDKTIYLFVIFRENFNANVCETFINNNNKLLSMTLSLQNKIYIA